ncbi:MAG TPA: hypothetical protein VGP72_19370 [Planctomycetota bacterium]|jgi:hypothetical protein
MGDGTPPEPVTTAAKKRPWFQFHLSTLIVTTFVAAGLMWLNCRTYHGEPWWHRADPIARGFNAFEDGTSVGCGWPWCFWVKPFGEETPFFYDALAADVAVAVAILFAVALVLEWRIPRQERP